ncbi:MAG: type II toxin-antitoxin system PemK/MazF family toxin [Gammaproteobacteria bacterium]|nr:type II toxin-antitoxin system PemK/MazF family toxin [Gammaproteobacteria bacterium]
MTVRQYIPKRGDIVWVHFDPSAGHEQAGKRPAIVLTEYVFNEQIKLALVAPITNTVREHGFEVELIKQKTTGAVLCQQIKIIDFYERELEFIEKAKKNIIDKVLKISRILLA